MMTEWGVFSRYDHTATADHPLADTANALCIRNAAGQDFYDLRNGILNAGPQLPRTWLVVDPASRVIQVATATVDLVFPQDRLLVSTDPVADPSALVGKVLNADGTISEAPPPPAPPAVTYKADIWRRATDAEAHDLDALLASKPVRLRNLFRDATVISHADPLYPAILADVTSLFGADRAAVLLAPSA